MNTAEIYLFPILFLLLLCTPQHVVFPAFRLPKLILLHSRTKVEEKYSLICFFCFFFYINCKFYFFRNNLGV